MQPPGAATNRENTQRSGQASRDLAVPLGIFTFLLRSRRSRREVWSDLPFSNKIAERVMDSAWWKVTLRLVGGQTWGVQ